MRRVSSPRIVGGGRLENTNRIVIRDADAELVRRSGLADAGIIRARIRLYSDHTSNSVETDTRRVELVPAKPIAPGTRQSSEISFRTVRISAEATFRRQADVTIPRDGYFVIRGDSAPPRYRIYHDFFNHESNFCRKQIGRARALYRRDTLATYFWHVPRIREVISRPLRKTVFI